MHARFRPWLLLGEYVGGFDNRRKKNEKWAGRNDLLMLSLVRGRISSGVCVMLSEEEKGKCKVEKREMFFVKEKD